METGGSTIRRRDIAGFSLTEGLYAAGVSLPAHCHADAYLTVVLSGNYIERYSHREFQWGEGDIHLLPAGEHHENHFLSAVRLLRVKIGPDVVQRLGKDHARTLAEPREIAGPLSKWLANRMMRLATPPDHGRAHGCPLRVRQRVIHNMVGARWSGSRQGRRKQINNKQ